MRMRTGALTLAVIVGAASTTDPAAGDFVRTNVHLQVTPTRKTCTVLVTAFTSEAAQTDETPHITSSQTPTQWGVVAARWLPIGTRIRLPKNFPDAVFVVEDRMPVKNWCKLDLWHPELPEADGWGIQFTEVEVLDVPDGFSCPTRPATVQQKCPVPTDAWGKESARPHCPSWKAGCPQYGAPVRVALSQ